VTAPSGGDVFLPAGVDGALFGFPLFDVRDIGPPPRSLVGSVGGFGPRGYVGVGGAAPLATIIDLRAAFGRPAAANAPGRSVVYVEHDDEAYGLIADAVGPCVETTGPVGASGGPLWAAAHAAEARGAAIGPLFVIDLDRLMSRGPSARTSADLLCGRNIRGRA